MALQGRLIIMEPNLLALWMPTKTSSEKLEETSFLTCQPPMVRCHYSLLHMHFSGLKADHSSESTEHSQSCTSLSALWHQVVDDEKRRVI